MARIALAGGNEFRSNCVAMDRELLKMIDKRPPRVAIMPTAADEHPDLAAANGVRYFQELGADTVAPRIVDHASANDPSQLAALRDADIVYFVGGNPRHLLAALRDSPVLDALHDVAQRGGVIAGSSAGAMILGERMVTREWTGWIPAFGLARGCAILPHFEPSQAERNQRLRDALDPGITILGIPEATACLGDDTGTWRVAGIGSVMVYTAGQALAYAPGESFMVR